jgi:hypothetical protein
MGPISIACAGTRGMRQQMRNGRKSVAVVLMLRFVVVRMAVIVVVVLVVIVVLHLLLPPARDDEVAARLPRGAVGLRHGLPQPTQRDPVGRVLEARHVQHQHHLLLLVVASQRAEVAVARLSQRPAGEVHHQEGLSAVVVGYLLHQLPEPGVPLGTGAAIVVVIVIIISISIIKATFALAFVFVSFLHSKTYCCNFRIYTL